MSEAQKKLQELSESYQSLQAGREANLPPRKQFTDYQRRARNCRRVPPEAGIAAAGEHDRQEGAIYSLKVWIGAKTTVQEFDILDDEANIYKQIGPVLLKQDKTEALMSVNGRLEFIEKEIKRIEAQIKGIQEKSEKLKVEVGYPL
jgi:prefoldin beta subunit